MDWSEIYDVPTPDNLATCVLDIVHSELESAETVPEILAATLRAIARIRPILLKDAHLQLEDGAAYIELQDRTISNLCREIDDLNRRLRDVAKS